MSKNEVDVSERRTPYRGYMRLDHYKIKHTKYDGSWTPDLSREVIERGNAVSVLPFDPYTNTLVLIEQFRIGGYTAPNMSAWQIECVAGMIEPHQTAIETAHRETLEETGLQVLDLEPIYTYLSSPGCTSETIEMFCGHVDADNVSNFGGLETEGEYIRVFTLPVSEAFDWVNNGKIQNGMTIIALLWLKNNIDLIKVKWRVGE